MKQVRKETKNGKVLVLKPWKRKQNRENERHFQYFLFSELHACSRSSGASSLRATKSLIFDPKYGLGMSRVTSRVRGMRVCNRIYLTTPSSLWGPGRHYTGREPCWKKKRRDALLLFLLLLLLLITPSAALLPMLLRCKAVILIQLANCSPCVPC